jgi:hypothetical protein
LPRRRSRVRPPSPAPPCNLTRSLRSVVLRNAGCPRRATNAAANDRRSRHSWLVGDRGRFADRGLVHFEHPGSGDSLATFTNEVSVRMSSILDAPGGLRAQDHVSIGRRAALERGRPGGSHEAGHGTALRIHDHRGLPIPPEDVGIGQHRRRRAGGDGVQGVRAHLLRPFVPSSPEPG